METRRVLLWLTGMGDVSSPRGIINTVLLPLQLLLGLWQIAKLTPLWAVMRCTMSWLMMLFFPCLSWCCSDYILLKKMEGRVFKRVICYVTTPVHDLAKKKDVWISESPVQVFNYLGQEFKLERKRAEIGKESEGGDKLCEEGLDILLLNDAPKYYVTDEIWHSILCIKEVLTDKKEEEKSDKKKVGKVFIKNHKEIWEEVVTGRVMRKLEEVLDSVILDNHTVSRLDHEYFLPIDLISSDEKILKVLNLLGLYLQKDKHIHWLIPALLSLTAAVLGLCSTLRRCVYSGINTISRGAVHLLCDHLDDFSWRRQAYSLGNWIDNLKPSNDLQSKVVRGDIRALIAGGARVDNGRKHYDNAFHGAIRLPDNDEETLNDIELKFNQGGNVVKRSFDCGTFSIDCEFHSANGSLDQEGAQINGKCLLEAGKVASIDVDCNSEEAKKLFKFAYHMAHSQSGSLRRYDPNTKTVQVRRFRESVIAYVRSGYPPLYALDLKNVVVN
ncbi:hypothetical protein KI387_028276 [Taxus chinensis]|uniref:Uncharacterized protein n=1 Tax=Taxus chinensis TaxID=29808 RepID=A0AA38G011_TAXCH|nr:hypothetical protein KI387_028276 [Taxus chinensis]